MPYVISDECCGIMKEKPFRKYESDNNVRPIIATMATDSYRRKHSWMKTGCNAFDCNLQSSKPISFWKEQDILQYLKQFEIPYCSVYGDIVEEMTNYKKKENKPTGKLLLTGLKNTGCMWCPTGTHLDCPNKFQILKQTHPKQYDYCIRDKEQGGLGMGKFLDCVGVDFK